MQRSQSQLTKGFYQTALSLTWLSIVTLPTPQSNSPSFLILTTHFYLVYAYPLLAYAWFSLSFVILDLAREPISLLITLSQMLLLLLYASYIVLIIYISYQLCFSQKGCLKLSDHVKNLSYMLFQLCVPFIHDTFHSK